MPLPGLSFASDSWQVLLAQSQNTTHKAHCLEWISIHLAALRICRIPSAVNFPTVSPQIALREGHFQAGRRPLQRHIQAMPCEWTRVPLREIALAMLAGLDSQQPCSCGVHRPATLTGHSPHLDCLRSVRCSFRTHPTRCPLHQ